ncbi:MULTISPECIES: SGNH/GDSL hydrolase family protein [Antrihabitans]|uniref:SGNH/GDSL hydrolase family protein n=1 Tax=Antrihabitans spumae TaxID=3373370 RepID=A0ABW7KEJ5_9NOCA|nr:SGNH/GDSL hydrolase family protein [Antrihabitans stalagmiti]
MASSNPRTGSIGRYVAATSAGLLLAAAAIAIQAAPRADAAPIGETYVALGDSYAAGSVVLPQTELLTCARSAINYPALVAKELGATTFRDVTCGSATAEDFVHPQAGNVLGTAAPQYDALSADTTLVTVTIGGNDIDLADSVFTCVNPLPEPNGRSCADGFTAGGRDVFADRIAEFAPTYGTVIDQIRSRAPQAEIVLVGYPSGFQPGGCPGMQPVWPRDADYIQRTLTALNAVMAEQAAANGATYVDVATSSVGHDACAAPGVRWLEGIVPSSPTSLAPIHPNAAGQANMARQVLAALGR